MAGTAEGGKKARETNLKKYGADFYANIGQKGGQLGRTGGFASDVVSDTDGLSGRERASVAGKKGGHTSRRSKKNDYYVLSEPITEQTDQTLQYERPKLKLFKRRQHGQ